MIFRDISKLVEKAGSRYGLIVSVTKRARDLTDGATPFVDGEVEKAVSLATEEFSNHYVDIVDNND